MADRDGLLALAERCETEEPSRELDASIAAACRVCDDEGLGRNAAYEFEADGKRVTVYSGKTRLLVYSPKRYTTSIDAAVTLVPDGRPFVLRVFVQYTMATISSIPEAVMGKAKTPALALCAAALRAPARRSRLPRPRVMKHRSVT